MKRTILSIAIVAMAQMVSAQCTPDPIYQDSVFGAWPDTVQNFVLGAQGSPYTQVLTFLVPTDAGLINPAGTGSTIDSISVLNVVGLPPGLSYACNSHTPQPCTYLPTVLGCAVISGTPTQMGSFPITIDILVYASTFIGPTTLPYQFPGYEIIVGTVGVEENTGLFSSVTNVPNPFSNTTSIRFNSKAGAVVGLKVFDLLGAELHKTSLQVSSGQNDIEFDGSLLENGIYLYELSSGGNVFTGRMVLNR